MLPVPLGTLDGANVEIHEQVGDDNIVLFGLKTEEVNELWRQGYNPLDYVRNDGELKAVMDLLMGGISGMHFDDIVRSLTTNHKGPADPYMCLADFHDYVRAQRDVSAIYGDKTRPAGPGRSRGSRPGTYRGRRGPCGWW